MTSWWFKRHQSITIHGFIFMGKFMTLDAIRRSQPSAPRATSSPYTIGSLHLTAQAHLPSGATHWQFARDHRWRIGSPLTAAVCWSGWRFTKLVSLYTYSCARGVARLKCCVRMTVFFSQWIASNIFQICKHCRAEFSWGHINEYISLP